MDAIDRLTGPKPPWLYRPIYVRARTEPPTPTINLTCRETIIHRRETSGIVHHPTVFAIQLPNR